MIRSVSRLRTILYTASAAVLAAGLTSAVAIYRAALREGNAGAAYEVIGGFIYPGGGGNSKKYIHDLQVYGGNAAVLADEFMRWFSGLWSGTRLAWTIACIALVISLVIFLVANTMASHARSVIADENRRHRTG